MYVKVKALPIKVKALPVKVVTACKDLCTDCKSHVKHCLLYKTGDSLFLFLFLRLCTVVRCKSHTAGPSFCRALSQLTNPVNFISMHGYIIFM